MKEIIVQNILESMSIGLLVIDGQGEIIATNDAVASSLGYTQEDLWGKGWAELFFVEENNEAFNQIIIDVITKQKIKMHQKVPYVKPSGERVQLAITSSYLRDQERAVGIVVLIDDITELERLHENEKRTLEEMNRLQRERVESLNLFAMSVAHQIRNPLTSMGGFATRLFKSMNPQQPNPYLEPIMEGMDRLETIVRAVEEYTAVSRPEMAAVSLREVVDQVLADLDLEASKLKKRIDWAVQLAVDEASLAPQMFAQALTAILLNALESFYEDKGRIEITARKGDGCLIVEVSDSGAGIDEKDRPFVFDPFFTTKAVGVGMGLSMAERIIAEHQGRIQLESEQGKGTKVTMTLQDGR